MSCLFKLYCPSKREEGQREGGKKEGRDRGRKGEREREKSLVSKVLTENINSTKSTKRAFFPLRMKKKIQLHSKTEGLNEHSQSFLS